MLNQGVEDKKQIPAQFTFVNAGAGAGKTTNLVGHILETFARYQQELGRPPRVIGTTFTRKAANEIKDRVALQYQRYQPENQHQLAEFEKKSPYKSYIETHLEDLLRFAYSENLNITTIHGICVQIILRKAHLLGYSPNLRIVSESHLGFYQKRLLFKFLSEEPYSKLYDHFSFSEVLDLCNQLSVHRESLKRPATLDDLNEIYQMFMEEFSESVKFILNFSESSLVGLGSHEDKARVYVQGIKVALNAALMKNDLGEFFKILETFDKTPSIRGAKLDQEALQSFNNFKQAFADIKDVYLKPEHFSKYFDKRFFPKVCEVNALLFELYQKYESELREYKIQNSIVLMNEVEELALEILTRFKDDCQDYIDMWDCWYIDEYQDTSPIQNKIFEILLKGKSYYKVGDPQQSIYLFRGAEASLFTQEWESAQNDERIEDRVLDINYRSHPNLMAGMNEFFKHLEEVSSEFRESFNPMKSSEEVNKNEPARFNLRYFTEPDAEKNFVISEIKKLEDSGVLPQDICILARSRNVLQEYEQELTLNNIPCLAQFSGGFLSRPEIEGVLCFAQVMHNPHNDLEMIKLLRTQDFKVEDEILKTWCDEYDQRQEWSLWSSVLQTKSHPAVQKLQDFYAFFKSKDYVEGFKRYFHELKVIHSGYDGIDQARRMANLMKLYSYICKCSESNAYTLENLISDLNSAENEELQSEAVFSESQSGVRLFTIHGSKGLEFKYVFLVGGGKKGALSHTSDFEKIKDTGVFVVPVLDIKDAEKKATVIRYFSHKERILAEKKEIRRVIYVAATRAKEQLYISGVVKKSVDKKTGEEKIFASTESLFHIIDINSFALTSWQYIGVQEGNSVGMGGTIKDSDVEIQCLQFEVGEDVEILHRDKLVYDKSVLNVKASRDTELRAYSVSALVEAMAQNQFQGFDFKEKKRLNISKVDFGKILTDNKTYSSLLADQFLKPYIGDIFHKAIELHSKNISDEDLRSYLAHYVVSDPEVIYNMILEISSISEPNMRQILKHCQPEWGFNSILDKQILLSGKIDLWGFDENHNIHIFDYKTGSSYHLKKAAFQLGLYKEVLKLIYPQSEIHTHVIYPAEGVWLSLDVGPISLAP